MRVYSVYGQDNDSYAFRAADLKRCPTCGLLLEKWSTTLAGVQVAKRRLDISCTYDGLLVGSMRFVDFCRESGFTDLVTRQLPDDPSFFALSSDIVVKFDTVRRRTRLLDLCSECGRYNTVAGATPVFLLAGEIVPERGFARTDLEFGSGDEQHPLLLCGAGVGQLLETRSFRGLELKLWEA